MGNARPLIFGPAYLDVVVTLCHPLLPDAPECILDQSLPATRMLPRADGRLQIVGPTGDRLGMTLPSALASCAATYELGEPVLARVCGTATPRTVHGEYRVADACRQLGGMGAGYAKALGGTLRMPLGSFNGQPDGVGREVLSLLTAQAIEAVPAFIPECESDTSLLLQSYQGDKLAIGVRQTMTRWQAAPLDYALAAEADALVFCGAPNALALEVLRKAPPLPVMYAPAMRHVCDRSSPLIALAPYVHYLTLNALEWAQLAEQERVRQQVPVITVTDGPRGSDILLGAREMHIPAVPFTGEADTNRAGETYGATFFRVLRRECPDFPRRSPSPEVAEHAGRVAARQAGKQLALRGFTFPPDDDEG